MSDGSAALLAAVAATPTSPAVTAIQLPAGPVAVTRLGVVDCESTLNAMRTFTANRVASTPDELWLCEHPSVYTQGVAGRPEHVLRSGAIPVVQTDRGGQITYHGPGQVVAYPLIDLRRLGIYVKEYVFRLEQSVLKTLADFGVTGHRVPGEPGVYVRLDDPFGHAALRGPHGPNATPFEGLGKVAALGVKVSRHCSYHGVALNVAMDLSPFFGINPCGHAGLRTVDLSTIGVQVSPDRAAESLGRHLAVALAR